MGLCVALHHAEQNQVDETAREGHADTDVQDVHQHKGQAGQHAVDHVHRECDKDEGEFQRLGDAGQESGQSSRQEQTACDLLLFRLCTLVHCQSCAGKTEHHEGELTGHETGRLDREDGGGLGGQLGEEDVLRTGDGHTVDDGSAADRRLPERHIEDVVQAEGDEGTLQQTVQEGACVTGSQNQTAQRSDTRLDDRPDIEHRNADDEVGDGADDGNEPGAAKERQHLRKLDLIEFVVECRNTQTDDDAAENAHLQRCDTQHLSGGVGRHGVHTASGVDHGLNGGVHDDIGHSTRQSGDLFFLACHADGDTHREQQRQVVEDRTAGLAHDVQNGINNSALMDEAVQPVGRQHGLIGERTADTQQQAGNGQKRDGQHKAASDTLQHAEDLVLHNFSYSFL